MKTRGRNAEPSEGHEEEEVAPAEDLMREHGVLNRTLLIYDDGVRRIETRRDFRRDVLHEVAGIVRRFIEEYHERLEENFLFPRFVQARRLVGLVEVLQLQHARGRTVTDEIERLTAPGHQRRADRSALVRAMRLFIRMYRPHEAREDTVLFPAFHEIVSPDEYRRLGEMFEDEEHERFGPRGFEAVVDEVAGLEREVGLYELDRFTPPASG
jgi:hemerythrin-like domain-containing protein